MGYYSFNEIWTPLKLIGIRIYKDDVGDYWYKLWTARRKPFK